MMYEFLNSAEFTLESISWHRGINLEENTEFAHRISKNYELDYIIKSENGQILIDGIPYDCRPDTIIFRGPGHHVAGKGRYESFYMQFYIDSRIPPEFPLEINALPPRLYALMYELFSVNHNKLDALRDFNTKRIIFDIFGEMLKAYSEPANDYSKDSVYSKVTEYINCHYAEKLTLDKIASRTGISKYSLCRIFKEKLGMPLFDYVEIIRVNNSAVLLNEKKMTIKEACYESGFRSMPTFFRSFKKVTGKTPAQYRQHIKMDEGSLIDNN